MKTERTHNNRTTEQKGEPCGGGAGCGCILMMPEGIIAVGADKRRFHRNRSAVRRGGRNRPDGVDASASMPSRSSGDRLARYRRLSAGAKRKFCYTSFTAEFPGTAIFETVRLWRPQDRGGEMFQNAHGNDAGRQGAAAAGCGRGRPQSPSV